MANINKSNTPKSEKDYWRSPPELVNDALKLLGIKEFVTDVCCRFETSINDINIIPCAETYIDESEDALEEYSWFRCGGSTAFCNPPFSQKFEFFQKAVEQVKHHGKQVLMVLPYTPTTKQWHDNVHSTDCIIYLPDGRYQYLLPDGSKPKSSCNFETCLILIVPFKCGNVTINYKRGL